MVGVAQEAEGQTPDVERVARVDIPGSFQRCLDGTAFPAQEDLSGGATPSLTPLPCTGGGQPTALLPQTWGQLLNVTKGGF